MNYYLKKRLQSGLSKNDMANELGLSYIRYSAIERGDVKMPTSLIDKFNEIINRGKENEIAKTESEIKADKFWQEVSQLKENHTYVLHDKMKEFNIENLQQLVNLLGYKSVGTIYNYLEGRNPVGSEFKKRLYNFFSDELNVQIPIKVIGKTISGHKRLREPAINKSLDKYYEQTDFKKLLIRYNITNRDIAKATSVHDSTISTMVRKKIKPSYKIIQKVKDYLDSVIADNNKSKIVEDQKNVNTAHKEEYISKQKLIDQCQKEINQNNTKIEELTAQIKELESKNETSTKFIALVTALQ